MIQLHRTDDRLQAVDITGYVFPSQEGQPVLVTMVGSLDPFLPVFATSNKLRAMMRSIAIPFDAVKQIDDPVDFVEWLPLWLRIMIDPYRTVEGRIRFKELIRETVYAVASSGSHS